MRHIKTFIIAILCMVAGTANTATARSITRTYLFHGEMNGTTCHDCYFKEEGKDARYNCFPSEWTYNNISSIHATLANGIVLTIASSNNQIFAHESGSALAVTGNVTVTIDGGNNYYIWRVKLYERSGITPINETYWDDANRENTHLFSRTINPGYFYRLDIEYSVDDIYLVNESSTTLSGVEDEYVFTGYRIAPEPTEVVCNGRTLTDSEYGLGWGSNVSDIGTGELMIGGRTPFHGSFTKYYYIVDPNSVPSEWTAGNIVEVTSSCIAVPNIRVTGTGNVRLVIDEGQELTLWNGITIADGANLIVTGPGTMRLFNRTTAANGADGVYTDVEGGMGGTGSAGISGSLIVNGGAVYISGGTGGYGGMGGEGKTGGKGGTGGPGISGSLTVNGGYVYVEGGWGGEGGEGGWAGARDRAGNGGDGGNGGRGINGSLTVNGGTVNVVGGWGESGGIGGKGTSSLYHGSKGNHGDDGKALGGRVICTAGIIQESDSGGAWTDLSSGSYSDKSYVQVAVFTPLTLNDNADNASAIATAAGNGQWYSVTLRGRTLFKDGKWNTLCLPFNVTLAGSQLAGAEARTLSEASLIDGTLTLNFSDPVDELVAGKPYIIKWDTETPSELTNPVFAGVTINADMHPVNFTGGSFGVTYDPISYTDENKSILFMGGSNTLYNPGNGASIGAFRSYFQLTEPSSVKQFVLNFGEDEDPTVIKDLKDLKDLKDSKDSWFDLSGHKMVNGKLSLPRGIYIHNGKKTIIK